VFIGMGATVLTVVQGSPPPQARTVPYRDSWLTTAPIIAFMGLVLVLGVYLPGPLQATLIEAAALLERRP
jgi:hydrogenase-4 component F